MMLRFKSLCIIWPEGCPRLDLASCSSSFQCAELHVRYVDLSNSSLFPV